MQYKGDSVPALGRRLGQGLVLTAAIAVSTQTAAAQDAIVHDSEYYILEAQNGERWATVDQGIDAKLAQFRTAMAASRRTFSTS